jgi:hypothetical protein
MSRSASCGPGCCRIRGMPSHARSRAWGQMTAAAPLGRVAHKGPGRPARRS